jgi:RNA polymerase sigma factor (sigma-70 family)
MLRNAMFEHAYPLALRAARVRAIAAVSSRAIPSADRQDAEQEALTGVWLALSEYDPARAGLRTFIEVVVRTRITSLLRAHASRGEIESVNAQYVAADGGFRRTELRAEVGQVLDAVSPFDRTVALPLIDCSAIETSQRLRVARATVYRSIARLRDAFTLAGLHRSSGRVAGC